MTQDTISLALSELRALLGDRLSTGQSVREIHGRDEAYSEPALPDAVAFPDNTEEVSAIMKICSAHKVPVVPFGIGTSLEGHVIPIHGGISVDTSRMNKVLDIHQSDLDAVVQPGVTRKQLNDDLRATGLMFTVDPGANATLGGMTSTRASGTNTVRYGTMRENVMALEVVLPDGRVINTGSRARKSSAGYDLTHLFVGSEGTLGIITELTVRLFGRPDSELSATCAFDTIDDAVNTVITAIQMGLPMARIELLDDVQMKGMNIFNPDLNLPEKPHLFIEFHGSEAGVKEQVDLFESVAEEFGVSGFDWATKLEDRERLWQARHNAYYAGKSLRKGCEGLVTDCCVPISALADCIARTKELIAESGLIAPIVGHVGDGNYHLLILVDPDNGDEMARAKQLASDVSRTALSFGGTVTGEHGVGTGKKKYMPEEHGEAYLLMAQLKQSIDPLNIMNPGKLVSVN
ncbi:putative FAD-linked oxidoreductase [Tritonibacter multivorans]|uniref:D-lactate dehydrogenase (cytochrome) n=1 Tax=Tritonibacter multivorans TaxID=928856 RepID=A0A0P1G3I2_9RHOB|nr:FAD-linked oxidase C-terminal domain-containing protein [Tritonibacter multivorans]MDA7419808.1 FAD-binding protein [Tritonibacter multivorans]CUH76219.1 putative FAD-linked oxidoreductase [Tritonibacter multivorans]SFC53049.1 D-lactate dehydrogenase (cytochrome) [Tritonibacter multivorans]